MPRATYRGPKARLKISESGRIIVRGRESEITHREAAHLAGSSADVVVEGLADFSVLTVSDLKKLCRQQGLQASGTKDELIDGLLDTTVGTD